MPLTTRDMPGGAGPTPEDELRRIGDQMQSALSRIITMLEAATDGPYPPLDYETQMAVIEAHSCIEQWTEVRRGQ